MDDRDDKAMKPARGKRPARGIGSPPQRRARGFKRAGGLIDDQLRTNAAKRGFAQARLAAMWPEMVGAELAGFCTPIRLSHARGPAGGTLTLAVAGAVAPQIQMMIPSLRESVNGALGPGTVGRIVLTHASNAPTPALAPTRKTPEPKPTPLDDQLTQTLSSIGDQELKSALETLARNVLSKTKSQ